MKKLMLIFLIFSTQQVLADADIQISGAVQDQIILRESESSDRILCSPTDDSFTVLGYSYGLTRRSFWMSIKYNGAPKVPEGRVDFNPYYRTSLLVTTSATTAHPSGLTFHGKWDCWTDFSRNGDILSGSINCDTMYETGSYLTNGGLNPISNSIKATGTFSCKITDEK